MGPSGGHFLLRIGSETQLLEATVTPDKTPSLTGFCDCSLTRTVGRTRTSQQEWRPGVTPAGVSYGSVKLV